MVETSMCSYFRDKAYGTESSKANNFSEVSINRVFQYDKCVILNAKLLVIETVTLTFLKTSETVLHVWELYIWKMLKSEFLEVEKNGRCVFNIEYFIVSVS